MDVRAIFELPVHIWVMCDALDATYPPATVSSGSTSRCLMTGHPSAARLMCPGSRRVKVKSGPANRSCG